MIGVESIRRQHPAYLSRGSRPRKRELGEIRSYLLSSRPGSPAGDYSLNPRISVFASPGRDGFDRGDRSYIGSDDDGDDMNGHAPPASSDSTTQNGQQSQQNNQQPCSNPPKSSRSGKFSFVWVNMADETHGCNSFDSYHLVAALNRLGLGRHSCTNRIPDPVPELPGTAHTFFRRIHQLFRLDKSQREIWAIQMLYIPSDEMTNQRYTLLVNETTWGEIRKLVMTDKEAGFEWRVYTCRKEMGASTHRKKRATRLVSTPAKVECLELLGLLADEKSVEEN